MADHSTEVNSTSKHSRKSSSNATSKASESTSTSVKKDKRKVAPSAPSDTPLIETESSEINIPAGDLNSVSHSKKRRSGPRPKKVRESSSKSDLVADAPPSSSRSTKTHRKDKSSASFEDESPLSTPSSSSMKSTRVQKSPHHDPVAPVPTTASPTPGPINRNAMTPPTSRSSTPTAADAIASNPRVDGSLMSTSAGSLGASKPKLPGSRKMPSDAPQLVGPQPVVPSLLLNSVSKPTLTTSAGRQADLASHASLPVLNARAPAGQQLVASPRAGVPALVSSPALLHKSSLTPGVAKSPSPVIVAKGPSPVMFAAPGSRIFSQPTAGTPKPVLPGSRALLPADTSLALPPASPSSDSGSISVRSGSGQDFVDDHNEQVPKGLPVPSLLTSGDSSPALKMPAGPSPVIGPLVRALSPPQLLPGSASIVALPPVPAPVIEVPCVAPPATTSPSALEEDALTLTNPDSSVTNTTPAVAANTATAILSNSSPGTIVSGKTIVGPSFTGGAGTGANIGASPSANSPAPISAPVTSTSTNSTSSTNTTSFGQAAVFSNRGYSEFPKRILDHHGYVAIIGGGNELSELPLALASRTSITRLEFPSNQFKELPLVVTELPHLSYLDFSRNKISLLAPAITSMVSLKHLFLAHNRLRAFPNHLASLPSLEILDLSGNKLKTLPPQIGQLNSLLELRLSSCDLEVLPPEIGLLGKLKTLILSNNSLNKIPNEFHSLYGLTALDLGHNLFTNTPSALFYASSLEDLNLEHNEILSVAENIAGLGSLKRLNLENNKLSSLPYELAHLTSLNTLLFSGNSLSSIPVEYQQDTLTMIEYLTRLKLQSTWKRRKLVLVGEEFVGKTSLRMQLLNSCATKSSKKKRKQRGTELQLAGPSDDLAAPVATDGIDIEDWEPMGTDEDGLEPITFSVWDFAGQQIYHPTHQFFITNRSMYLIIFNLMDERTSRVEYWLKTLRVRTDGKSPVIVVGTHADDKRCDAKHIETIFKSMQKKYSTRFPFVRDYVAISSKTGKNLPKLTESIVALARSNASFRSIPDSYSKLEKTILQLRTQSSTLAFNDFAQVAATAGVSKEECVTCLEFLHDVGLVVYFDDKTAGLSELVILDPHWIVNLLSSIITLKHSYAKDGIMMSSCLPQIWKEYQPSEYNWLLKLLEKFEITFRIVASVTTGETTHDIRARWIRTLVDDLAKQTAIGPTAGTSGMVSSTGRLGSAKDLSIGNSATSPTKSTPLGGNGPNPSDNGGNSSSIVPPLQLSKQRTSITIEAARSPLQDMIVIPSLLPAMPAETHFNELWKDHSLFEPNVTGRRYLFQFLPLGFFSRLIVRTLHMSGLSPQYLWRDGMIIDSDCERAMLIHNELDYMLDIIVKTKKAGPATARAREERRGSPEKRRQMSNGGIVTPRTTGQAKRSLTAAFTLLRQLSDCIETLLVSWFKLKVIVQVPCHHCLHEKLFENPDVQTYHFPIEECMLAVREGKVSVTCHADRRTFKKKLLTGSVRGSVKGANDHYATGETIFNLWASPSPNPTSAGSSKDGKDANSTFTSPVPSLPGSPPPFNNAATTVPGTVLEMPKGTRVAVVSGGSISPRPGTPPVPTSPTNEVPNSNGGASTTNQGQHHCLLKELCPDIAFSDVSDMTVNYEDLNVGAVIGEGSYAELRTGTYNGEMVAVKVLKHQNNDEGGLSQQMDLLSDSFRELQHETFVMKNLKHKNLVNLKAICTHPLAMVVDYFPLGSLDRHLRDTKVQHPCLSWKYRVRLALNIAQGMDYLHSEDFMHRDLRSPNILIASRDENDEIVAKVADFGLAVICAKEFKGGDFNECWTAPEILKAAAYNSKVDVYSFAIVMWELLELGHPFKEYEDKYASLPRLDFFDAIIKGLRPSFPPDCPEDYIKLVTACWATEPEDRPSFDRIADFLTDMLPLASIWDSGDISASHDDYGPLTSRSGSGALRNLLRKKSKEGNLLLRMRQAKSNPDVLELQKSQF